jgi:hypothetical protein
MLGSSSNRFFRELENPQGERTKPALHGSLCGCPALEDLDVAINQRDGGGGHARIVRRLASRGHITETTL